MRWLLIGLLISVAALLAVAGSALRYVRQQRRTGTGEVPDALAAEESDRAAKTEPQAKSTSNIRPGEKL